MNKYYNLSFHKLDGHENLAVADCRLHVQACTTPSPPAKQVGHQETQQESQESQANHQATLVLKIEQRKQANNQVIRLVKRLIYQIDDAPVMKKGE